MILYGRTMLASSIGLSEVLGAFLLFIGFAVRWVSLPLLALMLLTALVSLNGENILVLLKDLLSSDGFIRMETSTFSQSCVYFLMLLSLFFMGAGRYFSLDWFLYKSLDDKINDTKGWSKGVRVAENIRPAPLANSEANKNRISQI